MPLALRARSLWKSYAVGVAGCSARIWVLRGATLELYDGERVAVLGARGAGTTTLLHCLAGFRRLDAGTIEYRRPPLLLAVSHGSSTKQPSTRRDDVVLLDDTTPQGASALGARVVREPAECGAAMIIATHSLSSVRHCVDRALLLRDGRLTDVSLRSGSRRVAERSATSDTRARARPGTARA